jgi:TonB family protein
MLVHQVTPVYPASARISGVHGTVVLQATIGTDGRIKSLKPVSSPSDDLTDAAVAAVEQWTYKPFTLKGEPVEILTTIEAAFALR